MVTWAMVVCVTVILLAGASAMAAEPVAFPGKRWEEAPPESQGVGAAGLDAAMKLLGEQVGRNRTDRAVVVRNGRLIWKGAEADCVQGIWSATKSFTSTVLGLLVDDGKCTLDSRAAKWLPAMAETYPDVTLRHFATMTSGYRAIGDEPQGTYAHGPSKTPFAPSPKPLFAPPGAHFVYWDSAMNQFGNVLTHIAGESIKELFKRRVADPIGMDPAQWDWGGWGEVDGLVVQSGSGNHNGHVRINALELARFGHLFLCRGRWNGRQLVSESWVRAATSVQVRADLPPAENDYGFDGRGVYGLNWWINGVATDGRRRWPAAPPSTFSASGFNNNKCFVVPEWNMVVVRLGLDGNVDQSVWNAFFEKLGSAVTR